jgi:putative transposase
LCICLFLIPCGADKKIGNKKWKKKHYACYGELAKNIKTEADLKALTKILNNLTVETALNAELTEHLGHEKHNSKLGSNARNGFSKKTLITDDGSFALTTPRDREGSFEPQLVKM